MWSASSGYDVTVCAINDHPSYDDSTTNYDYSVLTLCSELVFTTVRSCNFGEKRLYIKNFNIVTNYKTNYYVFLLGSISSLSARVRYYYLDSTLTM